METEINSRSQISDPWRILGISPGTDDGDIRGAYLAKVREFPPDRDPESFERVRDAYEKLKDPVRRSLLFLELEDPVAPLTDVLEGTRVTRRFVGPGPWLQVLREL